MLGRLKVSSSKTFLGQSWDNWPREVDTGNKAWVAITKAESDEKYQRMKKHSSLPLCDGGATNNWTRHDTTRREVTTGGKGRVEKKDGSSESGRRCQHGGRCYYLSLRSTLRLYFAWKPGWTPKARPVFINKVERSVQKLLCRAMPDASRPPAQPLFPSVRGREPADERQRTTTLVAVVAG
jgi:hypothetical protein